MASVDSAANGPYEDKENLSPSPTKPLYPKLPHPPPPIPSNSCGLSRDSPLLSYDQAKRPGQTPNTGRKRRALATLINSPPRPSYADKVRGLFREPVPKLHRWDGFGLRTPSLTIPNTGRVRKEVATPWSPLESEAEREVDWVRSRESVGSESMSGGSKDARKSVESLATVEHNREGMSRTATPVVSTESPENPIRDLEEACELPPAFVPSRQEHNNIPQIQEPVPTYDESSDSWTGDDEFLPRSARRQKRIDRKLDRPKHPSNVSAQLLRPQAPAYTSPSYPWPTALSKPSRFRAAMLLNLYPELPKSPGANASDHRASDADDEDSTSS